MNDTKTGLDSNIILREWINHITESRGWTINQWAGRAGTHAQNIYKFMNENKDQSPRFDTIYKLADAAGANLIDLRTGKPVVEKSELELSQQIPVFTDKQIIDCALKGGDYEALKAKGSDQHIYCNNEQPKRCIAIKIKNKYYIVETSYSKNEAFYLVIYQGDVVKAQYINGLTLVNSEALRSGDVNYIGLLTEEINLF